MNTPLHTHNRLDLAPPAEAGSRAAMALSLLAHLLLAAALAWGLHLPGVELPPARGPEHRTRCLAALAEFGA